MATAEFTIRLVDLPEVRDVIHVARAIVAARDAGANVGSLGGPAGEIQTLAEAIERMDSKSAV